MARSGTAANQDANNQYSNYETQAVGNYNSDMNGYNSKLSQMEGAGNPYQSKSYLQNQNMLTSAAMNSQNTQAKQQLQDTALRTGTNTAALGGQISENARAGQRTMDQYNAGTATQNQDKYLQYEQNLLGDQLAGANSQAGIYATDVNGRNNADSNLITAQGQNQQMWGNIIGGVAGGVGGAFAGKA